MTIAFYLGDETSAAGWRLAGLRTRTPAARDARAALAEACLQAQIVLLSPRVAAAIGERSLQGVLSAMSPLVLVVPDPEGDIPVADLAARLHAQLGLVA